MNVPFHDPPPLPDSFRAKVDHRVATHRRNRRVATASLVAAVAVVALSTALAIGAHRDQSVHTVDDRRPATTTPAGPLPTTSTVPPSTTTTDAPSTTVAEATPTTLIAGTPVTYGRATLVVPPGWSARYVPSEPRYSSEQCIAPDDTSGLLDIYGCQGILIFNLRVSGGSPRNSSGSTPDQVGWINQTGADCPFGDDAPPRSTGTSTTTASTAPVTHPLLEGAGTRVDSGYRPVGDRTAAWASFDVSCNVGPVHHVQVWVLPESKVGFESVSADPEVAAILTSVRINP